MNTLTKAFFSIPLTYNLLVVTTTIALTIYAACYHYLFLACSIYAFSLLYAFTKNNLKAISLLCTMLISSLCTIARVYHCQNSYLAHQIFLSKPVTIEGTIQGINHATLTKKQTTIILKTNNISFKNKQLHLPQRVTLFCPTITTKHIQLNQAVKIKNTSLNQPQQHSDYERYLIKEGVWATGHCNGNNIEIVQQLPPTIFQYIQLKLQQQIDSLSSILFEPLFLGIKEKNHANLAQQHQSVYWGIAHHMARSGVHLAILFTFLMLILHYTCLSYLIRYFLCANILLGYACISQASISFIRALIMILLHITCKAMSTIPSTLHILTLTTLITLLHNPFQIFFLDFQLSFGITYIIVWLFTIKKEQSLVLNNKHLVQS